MSMLKLTTKGSRLLLALRKNFERTILSEHFIRDYSIDKVRKELKHNSTCKLHTFQLLLAINKSAIWHEMGEIHLLICKHRYSMEGY